MGTKDEAGTLSRRLVLSGLAAGAAGVLLPGTAAPAGAAPATAGPEKVDASIPAPPPFEHRFNGVWRTGSSGRHLRMERTIAQVLSDYDVMWHGGYRLSSLTSHGTGNVYYSAVYSPGTFGQALHMDRTLAHFIEEANDMERQGWWLRCLNAYVWGDGQVWCDAVYNPNSSGQYLRMHRTYDQFIAAYDEMWNLNYRLATLVSYVQNGQTYYGASFRPFTSGQYLRLNRWKSDFLAEYNDMQIRGYRLAALSTHGVNGGFYNAAYTPGGIGQAVVVGQSRSQFEQTNAGMEAWGLRLDDIVYDRFGPP